jgi:hypothetical protein
MRGRLSYAALLDAIGCAVEQAGGTDVLVHEMPDGVLVSFVTQTEQQVITWTRAEVAQLHARATTAADGVRAGQGVVARLRGRRSTPGRASVRERLRAVGQYLDGRAARALVLQEHAGGCYVAFTDLQSRTMDLIRVTEVLDAARVAELLARPRAS